MARLVAFALFALCALAWGGCLVPTTCRDQCEAQRSDCFEDNLDASQQIVCENSAERCRAGCPPGEL